MKYGLKPIISTGWRSFAKKAQTFAKLDKIRIDTRLSMPVSMEHSQEDLEIIENKSAFNLKTQMIEEIKERGPLNMARFMHLCLADPTHGYYTTKHKIFNKGGDFTTSPEINQMFGEVVGVWYISAMEKYKNLKHFSLVEIGPGQGTLLCDILRAFIQCNVLSNMTFYLVEISDQLKEVQKENIVETLAKNGVYISQDLSTQDLYDTKLNLKFIWKKDINQVKMDEYKIVKQRADEAKENYTFFKRAVKNEYPFMVLAHELFDAIPVYQFIYDEALGWLEKLVDIDPHNPKKLTIRESRKPTRNVQKLLQPEKTFANSTEPFQTGDMIEISPQSQNIMSDIAELISMTKGAGLIFDYGEDQALTNSIRAIKKHKYLGEGEMLDIPGKADISAYVNFQALRFAADNIENVITRGPMPQGLFLESMGMNLRKDALKQANSNSPDFDKISKRLEDDYYRLVHPDVMGQIYKVLFVGNKYIGETYPFLDETLKQDPGYY